MKEEIPHRFWREYMETDGLEKDIKLRQILKMFEDVVDIKEKKVRNHMFTTLLRTYFDDLIEYMIMREK